MQAYVGKIVLYRWRPGQVRAGQTESAAMVTKVNSDGTVNLTVYPDGTPDPLYLKGIPALSEVMPGNCWLETAGELVMQARPRGRPRKIAA